MYMVDKRGYTVYLTVPLGNFNRCLNNIYIILITHKCDMQL